MTTEKDLKEIRKHVSTLNGEVSELILSVNLLKNDTKWIKWILSAITIPIALLAIKVILG